ncbi:translation initiation factor 2 [Actinoplanes sp. NPDC051851]|uniref:translation initiation factor 2 n=1 Tax=Actinoplanes sp. NPDC051851 TaxID=3154753 RepID=UPI00343C7BD6
MTSPTSGPDDDAYWQRPHPGAESLERPSPDETPAPAPPGYSGPPATEPPPAQWRPPTIAQPPPPRDMPAQDMDALDESEGQARTVTYGVGLVAAAVAIILMCLLCARAIF